MCDASAMYITNVEKEGPFLKVWGQVDQKAALDVERALYRAYSMYEDGKHLLIPGNLLIGVLCCAKYIDEKYYRARITNVDTRCQGTVEVNFIDYGNRDLVPIANLRSMDCFNETFITLPSLALPFIVSQVVCVDGEWSDISLEQISREIRYVEVKYSVISTHLGYQIITIYLADRDLASHLVQNNLMQSIPLETQESLLSKMIPKTPQAMPPSDQSLLQYKSSPLEPNSKHEVYVSYITDGPCHFSVQLKKDESILVQLMREINSIPLKPFEELPIPGTVCLAKCVEDSHICRAVITSEVDNQYKLFYVDFGNTEIVPPDNLYQMPFKYIIPKIMAIRLSLDGLDKSTVTLEMQCAFKQFVDNRLLMMEVFPSAKKMCLPKCRMWDPATNTDVMDILNKAAQLAFPNVIVLHRGFTRPVKVTFVYSCNKFYIHLKSNEDELSQLMANIQVYCNSASAAYLEGPKVGQPCCAQFIHDGQWYRSLIVALNDESAKVKYIDYGNEEDVPMQSLKSIEGEFLTCMRPQAIECCLNGYQNMTEDIERDNKLEELILDQEFTMKVIDIVNGKSLVDLLDSAKRSVTALLMEAMINQPKVQVIGSSNLESTPIKYDSSNSLKKSGKPHDEDQWSPRDKSEKSEDWRQSSRKQNGSMSNERTESWRQKNHKNDTEWHDNTSNDSFRKGRPNNESRKSSNPNLRYDGKYRNNRNEFRSQNSWSSPEKDKSFENHNSNSNYNNSHREWNGKETNNDRNRPSRQDNEGYSNKEYRNKPRNDNANTDNSTYTWGENEEFQGVKKRTKNFPPNTSSSRNRDRSDNEEWGNNKNSFNGNDYSEKKSYRDRNSYDSDGSYKKGKQERSFDNKPRYNNDRGDRKKSFRDNDSHMSDRQKTDGKKFSPRSDSKWNDRNNSNNSHKKSYNNETIAIDPAEDNAAFQTLEAKGLQKVTMSWFHNPCSFFCHLMDSQQNFHKLMEEIQEMYKDKPSSFAVEGAPAIALFPEDNVFYRSRILKTIGNQYKVYYVDFGNISVVDSVWPIDKKFMQLPMQAIPCGLGGIQPVGNDWPDPNAFVEYMQRDSLDCEFHCYEIDRYMVNLYSNNQDIKQQLVDNNLAKYVEASVPSTDFDIKFLAGHTFRAMLDSVNDLSDFSMSFSSGVQILCSAHNLAQATERFEDELKQKIGQVVVVYCDNLNGDRLEVTLYDHTGNKLNVLNPDEGAFDSIESICPFLLIKSQVDGFVSFVNDTSIIIQPAECTESLQALLNDIYEHYDSLPQEAPIIPEEGFVYAVRNDDDSNWYRGRVISFDDEKVTVSYIDYGNSEDVPFANLRELDPKFYWWDRMAILVEVNVPTADLLEKQVSVSVCYGENGLEGEILDVQTTCIPEEAQQTQIADAKLEACPDQAIELPKDGENKCDTPLPVSGENEITQNIDNSFHEEVPNEQNVVDGTAVVISHIDGPSDFYIQLADSQNAISELQSKIQEQIGEMSILDNTSIGGLCAAPYSVDQMWYRSQILDADEDITTVRFIDYGNTDVIDNKVTQIKTLPAEFLALEEYARRCRLKIKPLEEEWSKASTDRFEELAYAENVTVQFINQDEKVNHVELFSGGQNVKDILIAENLAVLDEGLVLDAKLKGYISHMNSPSEFWVQLDGWCAELEWIAEQLSNAGGFPDLEDFTPGSLCAAMFPDDEMWYRARILSNTVAGLEVLFLDYGNSCVCANLKQLPEHLVMASPLALKCSLQKPEGLFNWSPEAAKKFSDLSADGQTEFTIKKLTTGEISIVELYLNNEEVSTKLLPTTDDVYVTDIQSTDSFATAKEGTISDGTYRLEKIPGCDYNQECQDKFVEINNEGKTCYGIEYLSDNIVRLYVNGNDIRNEFLAILKDKSSLSSVVTCDILQSHDLETSELNDITQINEKFEDLQDASNVCSTSEGIHEESQEETTYENKIDEKPQEEIYQEGDISVAEEIHEVPQAENAQLFETQQEKEIEVTQEEVAGSSATKQTNDSCESRQEDSSKVCDTSPIEETHAVSQEEEIHELSQEGSTESLVTVQAHFESVEEGASKGNDILPTEETHEVSQEEEIHELSQEKAAEPFPANQQANYESMQEAAPEICDTLPTEETREVSQEEEIHELPQIEAAEPFATQQANYELIQDGAPEVCDTLPTEETHEVSQEEEIHVLSQEEAVEPFATQQANYESMEEGAPEVCATLPTEETHEVSQEEEIHELPQEETACDTTEIKGNTQETSHHILRSEEMNVLVQETDIDDKPEVAIIVSDIPNLEKNHEENVQESDGLQTKKMDDLAHENLSANCDMNDQKAATTSQTNGIQEAICEIRDLGNNTISANRDVKHDNEVTEVQVSSQTDVITQLDFPQGQEFTELVNKIGSEIGTFHENDQEEKNEVKESSDSCDKIQAEVVSAEVCDIPKHSLPIDSSKESEAPKNLQFTETIMTSFSAPTVSEKELVPKLSPTKVTSKIQDGCGDAVVDSSNMEE